MEELGLKKSLFLRICKIVCFILFLCYAAGMYAAFAEFRTIEDLTEAEREELIGRESFADLMSVVDVFEQNEAKYGKFSDVKSIRFIYCGCSSKRMAELAISKDNIIYVECSKQTTLITQKEFSDFDGFHEKKYNSTLSGHYPTEEIYGGVEVLFIEEVAKSENVLSFMYEPLKKKLEKSLTYKPAKQALLRYMNDSNDIKQVSCAYLNNDKEMMVKITSYSGTVIYCMANDSSASPQYTTSELYNVYAAQGKKVIYEGMDLKVLLCDLKGGL